MIVVLSPQAKADIDAIWDYTAQSWGSADQAERYVLRIRKAIEGLATLPECGSKVESVREGYLKYPVASHVIFYRLRSDRVVVIRILHRQMDFLRHLP